MDTPACGQFLRYLRQLPPGGGMPMHAIFFVTRNPYKGFRPQTLKYSPVERYVEI